jgi:hypothetical protein
MSLPGKIGQAQAFNNIPADNNNTVFATSLLLLQRLASNFFFYGNHHANPLRYRDKFVQTVVKGLANDRKIKVYVPFSWQRKPHQLDLRLPAVIKQTSVKIFTQRLLAPISVLATGSVPTHTCVRARVDAKKFIHYCPSAIVTLFVSTYSTIEPRSSYGDHNITKDHISLA